MTSGDPTMLEMMQRWPQTVPVIVSLGLYCAGCPVAGFHTLRDAAIAHDLDLGALRHVLDRATAPSRVDTQFANHAIAAAWHMADRKMSALLL